MGLGHMGTDHDWDVFEHISPTYLCKCISCGFQVFVCPGHKLYEENEFHYAQGMIVINLSTDNRMDPDQIIEKFMPEMKICGSFLIKDILEQ